MDERRELPRWEIKKQVKAWVPLTQGFHHCVIEDIHLKGMRVSFKEQLALQKTMRISFSLNDDYDFIKAEADIHWRKEGDGSYVYGLSFTKLEDEGRQRISQYVNTHCYDQMKKQWWA